MEVVIPMVSSTSAGLRALAAKAREALLGPARLREARSERVAWRQSIVQADARQVVRREGSKARTSFAFAVAHKVQ